MKTPSEYAKVDGQMYRIRQVGAGFVLEQNRPWGWQIIDHGYSWAWVERVAAEYHCKII